jgi:phospholipase/lecithinase/hemolysin
MKMFLKPVQMLRSAVTAGVALTMVLGGSLQVRANSQPFTRIFVFGDSLSDTGNYYQLSVGALPPAYYQGRFSNGRLWLEQLADGLGMSIAPGDNYAVGGAMTGYGNYKNGVNGRNYPGLQDEIASFVSMRSAAEARGALFIVWAGGNDFFTATFTPDGVNELIGNGVGNTALAIQKLYQAGARHIMVLSVPDLGLTPMGLRSGMGGALSQITGIYNARLNSALDQLAQAGIPTIRVDASATLQALAAQPAEFGFVNVTDPLFYVGGTPSEFLFWDDVHPTTAGHAMIAQAAADALVNYFSLSQGQGAGKGRINSLHGLVNAFDRH